MTLTSRGFPLFLTFDLDAETMWTARDPAYAKRPILMSQGAYGWKVGTGRVLYLLDRYGIKATFFVPGLIVDQREALIEEILRRGHELAHHSYSHAWILSLSPEQEREEQRRSAGVPDAERAVGVISQAGTDSRRGDNVSSREASARALMVRPRL